jgi:hypothetical protein
VKEAVEDLGSIWLELRGFANVTSVFTGKKDARTQIVAMPEEFVVVCGRNIIQYRFGKTLACVCVCVRVHIKEWKRTPRVVSQGPDGEVAKLW